jgi:hypothetical protein
MRHGVAMPIPSSRTLPRRLWQVVVSGTSGRRSLGRRQNTRSSPAARVSTAGRGGGANGLQKMESNLLIQRGIKVVIVVPQVLSHLGQPSARVMQARIEGPSVSGRKSTPSAMRCEKRCGVFVWRDRRKTHRLRVLLRRFCDGHELVASLGPPRRRCRHFDGRGNDRSGPQFCEDLCRGRSSR